MLKKIFKSSSKKNDDESTKIETLTSMGFPISQAKQALDMYDGNLERATNYLLSDNTDRHRGISGTCQNRDAEQGQLQYALNESMKTEQSKRQNGQSAASLKAGQAAAARAENANRRFGSNGKVVINKEDSKMKNNSKTTTTTKTVATVSTSIGTNNVSGNSKSSFSSSSSSSALLKHHPNVKIPTEMKDKSKEEQILRCTKRLAPYPAAVNTIHRALKFIQADPENGKYRKIDQKSLGYQRTLDGKPGALDLLLAMNFVSRNHTKDLILDRNRVDLALLYLGISALEEVKKTEEYQSALQLIEFQKELQLIIQNGDANEEIIKRAEYISKLPSEPSSGTGALMQISLGDEKIMRRFDGDDILRDVIHFIGGHGSAIPDKIASRQWCLVDLNQYPLEPIDVDACMNKTLQYIGCWPSGMLALKPSANEWKEGKQERVVHDTIGSRGLGATNTSI